jgi:hypothetical protein
MEDGSLYSVYKSSAESPIGYSVGLTPFGSVYFNIFKKFSVGLDFNKDFLYSFYNGDIIYKSETFWEEELTETEEQINEYHISQFKMNPLRTNIGISYRF